MMVASPTRDRLARPLIAASRAAEDIGIQLGAGDASMAAALHELLASAVRALIGDELMAPPTVWVGEEADLVWLRSVVIDAVQAVATISATVPHENELAYLTEYGEFDLDDPAMIEMSRYTETAYCLAVHWIDASA